VGFAVAIEPSSVAYANLVLTETPYELLLGGLALAFVAARRAAPSGLAALALAAGIAPLLRPIGLYLPPVVAAVLAAFPPVGRRRSVAAVVLVAALLPAAVWSARNQAEVGSFTLSTTTARGLAMFARDVRASIGAPTDVAADDLAVWDHDYGRRRGLSSDEISAARSTYVRETLLAHPVAAARLWARNLIFLVGVPESVLPEQLLEAPPPPPAGALARVAWLLELFPIGVWLLFGMLCAVAGLAAIPIVVARLRALSLEARALAALLAALALYHLALGALLTGQGARYRAPLVPILILFAALAARSAVGWRVSRRP
jgi:hypothetical protein